MNYYSHFLLIYLHHFIFRSSVSAPVLHAQFVQSSSEESHFVDGQAVFCFRLQVAEYLHRRHPFAFCPVFMAMLLRTRWSMGQK